MRFSKPFRALVMGVSALSLAACAAPGGGPNGAEPRTVSQRSSSDQRIGDENHPKIMAEFGGPIQDRALQAYVEEIGRKLAAKSEQPNAKWTFTVLDSPVVNAFALPGGYVYVTRGLIALANSEAELAGVIGHEIGHVTAAHSSGRQQRAGVAQAGVFLATLGAALLGVGQQGVQAVGQLGSQLGQGYVASYSRNQEFESDTLGVRYLARAGYDPAAQADFLANLQAETKLQARIAGGSYNPNRVDFLSSHPATAQRVREAIRAAGVENAAKNAPRNRERFLRMIDGLTYGDSAEQGFVDGRRFSHPKERFEFTMPEGFRIQNSASQVTAAGPNGSGIVFSGDRNRGGSMDAYIARTWAPAIAKQVRAGRLDNLRRRTINGLAAASATLPVQTDQGVRILRLTAIRKGDAIYRFMGVQPQGANGLGQRMDLAARSFRSLTAAQARRLKPQRITLHTVRAGETVQSLANRTPFDRFKQNRFRVLNDIPQGSNVRPGDVVKLIQK